MDPIQAQFRALRKLSGLLQQDVIAVTKVRNLDPQVKRRSIIRSMFAWIEAETFIRKQMALLLCKKGVTEFSLAELALLNEEQYDIDGQGNARTRQKFLRLADNVKFGIRCICKATGIDYKVETATDGWQAFVRSIKLGNRITHPRNLDELFITKKDLQDIRGAFNWFLDNVVLIERMFTGKCTAESLRPGADSTPIP